MNKKIIWCFLVNLILMGGMFSNVFAEETKDVQFFEVASKEIGCIFVNHEQGGICFDIQGISFFYYIQADENWQRIIASSELLEDVRGASTIQMKHVPYGYHRQVTNLLLFYGDRKIPENLKLDMEKIKKSIASQRKEMKEEEH